MALFIFGDSFDFYTAGTDLASYWDSIGNLSFTAGRFTGGQALSSGTSNQTGAAVKASGQNDTIHHITVAYYEANALTGTTARWGIALYDGSTAKCTIVFRYDGTILLQSGALGGATLATYTGAVSAQSTWTAFEFEVVIHGSAGIFRARKNGALSNDFEATGLNTAPSGNVYANALRLQTGTVTSSQRIDDLLWRSDTSAVAWIGDVRAYQLMPAADASVQFARSSSLVTQTPVSNTSQTNFTSGTAQYAPFVAAYSGTLDSATITITTGGTGNLKAALYDATRTTVLATSNAVVNPTAVATTLTFASPPTIAKGTTYHLAIDQDFTVGYRIAGSNSGYTSATAYGSFPAGSPSTSLGNAPYCTLTITPTNSTLVNETQQDGTTSYVYDATVGHADLYGIAPLPVTPTAIVAVTTRGYIAKSDAGTRYGQVQLVSGVAAPVTATSLALSTSFQWNWRTDLVDPNTGSAWLPAAVNAVQIGPVVVS